MLSLSGHAAVGTRRQGLRAVQVEGVAGAGLTVGGAAGDEREGLGGGGPPRPRGRGRGGRARVGDAAGRKEGRGREHVRDVSMGERGRETRRDDHTVRRGGFWQT